MFVKLRATLSGIEKVLVKGLFLFYSLIVDPGLVVYIVTFCCYHSEKRVQVPSGPHQKTYPTTDRFFVFFKSNINHMSLYTFPAI